MNQSSRTIMLVSLVALGLTLPATLAAQDNKPRPPAESKPPATQPTVVKDATPPGAPVYKPPLRGAPGGRVGGGTRGTGREMFVLSVLAPDHTGLTTQEQPDLYWFISSATSTPVELTITEPNATQPLLETTIKTPVQAGVNRIRLTDHGVRLAPGVAYHWFVAVVPDANRRSKDILAGGMIERVQPPSTLASALAQAAAAERPAIYADAGLWYDAFAALTALIDGDPSNATLRQQRTALLTQVGLPTLDR